MYRVSSVFTVQRMLPADDSDVVDNTLVTYSYLICCFRLTFEGVTPVLLYCRNQPELAGGEILRVSEELKHRA